jgi:hypothetical protein
LAKLYNEEEGRMETEAHYSHSGTKAGGQAGLSKQLPIGLTSTLALLLLPRGVLVGVPLGLFCHRRTRAGLQQLLELREKRRCCKRCQCPARLPDSLLGVGPRGGIFTCFCIQLAAHLSATSGKTSGRARRPVVETARSWADQTGQVRRMELPLLALPPVLSLAGIRTTTVINVGVAAAAHHWQQAGWSERGSQMLWRHRAQ